MQELNVYNMLKTDSPADLYKLSKGTDAQKLAPIVDTLLKKHYEEFKENKTLKDNLMSLVNLIYIRNQGVQDKDSKSPLVLKSFFTQNFLDKFLGLYSD